MTKLSDTFLTNAALNQRSFRVGRESSIAPLNLTHDAAASDLKLKRLLKKAVNSETAPRYLLNAIRAGMDG